MADTGTCTVTLERIPGHWVYKFEWTSNGSGAVEKAFTPEQYGQLVVQLETDPDATAVPTSYAVTLEYANGIDLLQGSGAGRHAANAELEVFATPARIAISSGSLYFKISGAGASKAGVAWIVLSENRGA